MSEGDQHHGSLNQARDTFVRALKAHEQFVYKLGYEAGFQAGWEALVRRLASQKPDLSLAAGHEDPEETMRQFGMDGPAQDTLKAIVTQAPGLERHEIIETARKAANISDRSLRTALQALRDTGVLRVEGGKWYPVTKKDAVQSEPPLASRRVTPADFDE